MQQHSACLTFFNEQKKKQQTEERRIFHIFQLCFFSSITIFVIIFYLTKHKGTTSKSTTRESSITVFKSDEGMTTFGCCYRCAPSSPSSSSLRRSNRRSNRRRRRKSNTIGVESKFTFLPSSAESFANTNAISDTTTFLDVARACARRLRLAKELHPSGKDAQIIVGIAGPPGGGKSTLAKQVCRQFRKLERRKSTNTASSGGGDRGGGVNEELEEDENEENENEQNTNNNNESAAYDIAIVPMDGYHYYRSQLEKMDNPQHALAKRGAPFTFDSERFVNDIVNLRKSGSGSFPSFDHGKGDPVENDILVEYKRHKIILVEGNYLFLPEQPWSRLLDETCFDEAWYVNCPVDEATKRVIDRHVRTGKTKETAELRAYSNDLANAKLVDANKRFADVMIPNAKRFS